MAMTSQASDLSSVSPQRSLLVSDTDPPKAESTLYVRRYATAGANGGEDHTVVGVTLVLKPDHPQGLWESFHVDRDKQKLDPSDPKMALRSLTLICDTLEIHRLLSLPEADVTIHARRLVFGTATAGIDTTPLDWAVARARDASGDSAGAKGTDGRHAGALRIFVADITPDGENRTRLRALGGRGQDGGRGLRGTNGNSLSSRSSMEFKLNDSGLSTSKGKVNFDKPAVYVEYTWKWGLVDVSSGKWGQNAWPGNGTDALAPGAPGKGGNGGGLTTNRPALAGRIEQTAGAPGTLAAERYPGGTAGTPTSCAKYKVTLWHNVFGTNNASTETKENGNHTSKAGKDATGSHAIRGNDGKNDTGAVENAWLHPLGVQATLGYARDLFIAGDGLGAAALLGSYQSALTLPMPPGPEWRGSAARWTAAQGEIASMLQRAWGNLDYFGNSGGFAPLLSLAGTIKLYQDETERALRTLLVTGWITGRERDTKASARALGESLDLLNQDTQQTAGQVTRAQDEVASVTQQINTLEQELASIGNQLGELRTKLLARAENDLRTKAQIKFAIKMAAAITQVIPVGQPVLGTLGNLASVAADFVDGDESKTPDTLSKMGDVLTKAREAEKKAREAAKKAAKSKDDKPAGDGKEANTRAAAWNKAGDGLGKAVTQVAQGIKALQVPQSEVEAELQRLEAESPEWSTLTDSIRELNEKKTRFANALMKSLQAVAEGFGRIAANADSAVSVTQARTRDQGRLDPEATESLHEMAQRSRLTLTYYLYLMVKAYESTVLKPLPVNWKLDDITEKLNELIKPDEGFDAKGLNAQVEALQVIFDQNLDKVRRKLLEDFDFNERSQTLRLGLSRSQTPELLDRLDHSGRIVIDPLVYGLVLSDSQLARLGNVTLSALEFDPDGPPLPETHNAIVSVQPAASGTMRRDAGLYLVHSQAPPRWSWTYLGPGKISPSTPSQGAEDLLRFVLGKDAEKIQRKLAIPPMWSELAIGVVFSPALPADKRPRLQRLFFEFDCEASPAPSNQRALILQWSGPSGGAVAECSADLGNRADGWGPTLRIYDKGARIRMNVPGEIGEARFVHWDLVGRTVEKPQVSQTEVNLKVDDHILAQSWWCRQPQSVETIVLTRTVARPKLLKSARMAAPSVAEAEAAVELVFAQPPAAFRRLRLSPADDAPVVGFVPDGGHPELLSEREGWQELNFRGVIGWARA